MEQADELFKARELPEKLGPMTVKELRQGLRRGMFVYPFLAIHLLAVVAMAVEFHMAEVEAYTEYAGIMNLFLFIPGHPWFSGPFWGVTGGICLILMPLGGLALMGQELEEGNHELLLMTPLSRWKVVRGKFLAMWGLCLLTFVSLLPYMIVRYLNGGMDTWRNIAMAITVVLFSGTIVAGAIGASSFTGIAGRIATLVLFLGSLLASLAIVGFASGGRTEGAGVIYTLNVLPVIFCYTIFGLALARSRIRLVVHHYEVKPSWMIIGLLFFTPFVVGMATAMTLLYGGGIGLIGMGLVGWFADVSPKAPKWVVAPTPNMPATVGAVPPPLPAVEGAQVEPPLPRSSVPDGEGPPVEGVSDREEEKNPE
jgi:ABC-2 type transport system permease protein